MSPRLLSFLTDVERSLLADDPSPDGGRWENTRTVNYHLGLARLALGSVDAGGKLQARGAILLQCFKLADQSECLKANLSWTGSEAGSVQALYSKPAINWTSEARRVAAVWQAGPPAGILADTPVEVLEPLTQAVAVAS